jgi:hypothetical protein
MIQKALKKVLFIGFLAPFMAFATDASVQPETAQTTIEYSDYEALLQNQESNNYDRFDGITSAVVVLNCLNANSLGQSPLGPQSVVTQENIFTPQVRSIVDPEIIKQKGIAIEQLSQVLEAHGVKTKTQYAHIMTKDAMKEIIKATNQDPNTMMIAHIDESVISMKDTATYVVVAAYDEQSDSVLVFSANPHAKPTQWIKADLFLKSMKSLDSDSCPRGFILATKPTE